METFNISSVFLLAKVMFLKVQQKMYGVRKKAPLSRPEILYRAHGLEGAIQTKSCEIEFRKSKFTHTKDPSNADHLNGILPNGILSNVLQCGP